MTMLVCLRFMGFRDTTVGAGEHIYMADSSSAYLGIDVSKAIRDSGRGVLLNPELKGEMLVGH